jgi:hypothetical protein
MRPEHRDDGDCPAEDDVRPFGEDDRRRVRDALSEAAAGVSARRVPEELCRACMRLLPVSGASVSLAAGPAVHATWCASDGTAALLAEAQYTLGEGPCQSALELGASVLAVDLTGGPDVRRWPLFARQAVELGVRAAFAFPLGTAGQAVGTLDLYRDTSGGLSDRDLGTALLVRDAMTYAVLNLESVAGRSVGADPDGVASWVAAALVDHTEVHQAIGMVMIQLGVAPEQALDRMRARAFAQGCTVSQVAAEVVGRTYRFRPEAGPGRGPEHGRTDDGPDR